MCRLPGRGTSPLPGNCHRRWYCQTLSAPEPSRLALADIGRRPRIGPLPLELAMAQTARFRVDPKLVSLLGEGYRSSEYALKELIDNAWDADATEVCITLPDPLTGHPIIVEDDGSGMTE